MGVVRESLSYGSTVNVRLSLHTVEGGRIHGNRGTTRGATRHEGRRGTQDCVLLALFQDCPSSPRPCLRGPALGFRVSSGRSYWSGFLGLPVPPCRPDSGLLEWRPHALVPTLGYARGRSGGVVCVRPAQPTLPPSRQARGVGLAWGCHACGFGVA